MDDFLKDSTPDEREALFDSLNEDLLQVFDEDTINLDAEFQFPLSYEAENEEEGEDRIRFLEEIGRGGMKVIHKCEVEKNGQILAIATLKDQLDPKAIERFLKEAKITKMLDHENIVKVYDSGLSVARGPYIAMKYSEGMSLSEILQEISLGSEELIAAYPLNKRLEIFEKVAAAIDYAHHEGVVHLDIKPENILVSKRGKVLVCDWGLARILPEFETAANYALSSISGVYAKGSPGYMAPEQIVQNEKTIETDIYQLGGLLYSILFYRSPVEGEDVDEILEKTVAGELDLPPESNENDLIKLIRRALAVNPSERFYSVANMMGAYRQISSTFLELERRQEIIFRNKIKRYRNGAVKYKRMASKTKKEVWFLIVVVALLLVVLGIGLIRQRGYEQILPDYVESSQVFSENEEEIDAENSYYKILKK
ncbi:MAG: serine/threonine protein kinase [Lentisphaerales bacterium]|nr:serine/threonine protein kinase [Lentisphaerales bacterium]